MRSRQYILWLGLSIITAGHAAPGRADISYSGGVQFLRIANSPEANGMGTCVVNQVNEESAYYNPGSLGLFHLDKVIAVTFPSNTKWVPDLADGARFKTWHASGGVSDRLITGRSEGRFNASRGLAYSYVRFDYGEFIWSDPWGETLSTYEAYDVAKCYTVGLGLEYYLRLGIGYTLKKIETKLAEQSAGTEEVLAFARADAHDYGLIVELPVESWFTNGIVLHDSPGRRMCLRLTPSFAYVRSNIGDDIEYIDAAQSDPLPTVRRIGFSVAGALNWNEKECLAIRGVLESETLLLGDRPKATKKGVELGALGTAYFRLGGTDDVMINGTTWGFGFRLRGVFQWLRLVEKPQYARGLPGYLARHLDLSFDFARWAGAGGKTQFMRFGLSF